MRPIPEAVREVVGLIRRQLIASHLGVGVGIGRGTETGTGTGTAWIAKLA